MPAKIKRNIGDIINTNKILKELRKNNKIYYQVQCILCGSIRQVRADNLHQQCRSCASKSRVEKGNTSIIDDLTGRTFGNWIVLYKAKKQNYWHCKDIITGTERDVFRGNLTSGRSKGDGSVLSWGETQISYLLNKYNISYKKEFIFKDFKTDKNGTPRFDFAIFNENDELYGLIEYDGRQHYNYNKNWKMKKQDFDRLLYIDNLKNQYCIKNNIILYRFNSQTNLEQEILKIANGTGGNKR